MSPARSAAGPLISLVVPTYNEEAVVEEFHRRAVRALRALGVDYEIIFVDDGSQDGTRRALARLREEDPRVRDISLSRNFGQQIAVTAGLDHARGQACVIMDADLQDPPEVLGDLIEAWREGYDVVSAVRTARPKEGLFKVWTAKAFYRVMQSLTDVRLQADAGDFRLLSRRAVDELRRMRERHRYVRGMASWIGFRQKAIGYRRQARAAGETKYPLVKMLTFAVDAIVSFSDRPLRLATWMGFGVSLLSVLAIVYFVAFRLLPDLFPFPPLPPGTTAAIVAIFFLGGVQLICLGIMGEYVGRMYEETKARPLYIVAEARGFPEGPSPGGSPTG